MDTPTTPVRCVCAAAVTRARDLYGHLEGERVWVRFTAEPTSRSLGTLRLPAEQPGYIYLDRGDPDRSKTRHIDDILDVVTDAQVRAQEQKTRAAARREYALELLEARQLQDRVTVETSDGQVVTGLLLDYSGHHLWLHRHDVEGLDRNTPWRAPLGRVMVITTAP